MQFPRYFVRSNFLFGLAFTLFLASFGGLLRYNFAATTFAAGQSGKPQRSLWQPLEPVSPVVTALSWQALRKAPDQQTLELRLDDGNFEGGAFCSGTD